MLLSVIAILVVFSQAPVIQLYYGSSGVKWVRYSWDVTYRSHAIDRKAAGKSRDFTRSCSRRFYGVHYLLQVGYLLALVSLILHILDRQVEYTSRTDILWKSKLRVEQDEVETMRGINKILLENILPAHVADHFLATRATQVSCRNLYSQNHPFLLSLLSLLPSSLLSSLRRSIVFYRRERLVSNLICAIRNYRNLQI
jgi:hypothetical protein